MQVYEAPLRDMRFVLHELYAEEPFGKVEANDEFDADLLDAILEEANKLATGVLLPLNRSGDEEGCHLENGVVRTPKGFKDAYDQFREGGWTSLAADPAWGGQGLPETVNKLVEEMISASNVSFGLYPGLTHGATTAMVDFASEDLKNTWLPNMVAGTWTGTMCLTEAHCGTDLGLLRTKAVPQDDGSYKVTGGKIFISAGDHDLSENIVHLVLARLPDAPPGIKGISMFLVPKLLLDDSGQPSRPNAVSVAAIEHKMGLKASATCQLNFDESTGWLVGEKHRGMQAMFRMMNNERVAVGVQGLGLGEAAYQAAVWYAKDRLQGRSLSGAKYPDKPADPIIVHPDVRRMLMTMRAYNEGCRAVCGWVARAIETAEKGTEPEAKRRAEDFIALMTPVVKALFTDLGFETANLAVQVYGGHGYIRESGVEQYVRDARIAQIYEGTNGIQALDLVGRKMGAHNGRYLRSFFHPVARFVDELKAHEEFAKQGEALEKAFQALQLATGTIAQKGLADPEEAGAAATEYLRLLGFVAMGYTFGKAMVLAHDKLAEGTGEADFYKAKIVTGRFFFDRLLPPVSALVLAIKRGKASTMDLPVEAF